MNNQIITRSGTSTDELTESVEVTFGGRNITYNEVYYLDSAVCEITGLIIMGEKVKHYTQEQMRRNTIALRDSYVKETGK